MTPEEADALPGAQPEPETYPHYLNNPNIEGNDGIIDGPVEMTKEEATIRNGMLMNMKDDHRWVIIPKSEL